MPSLVIVPKTSFLDGYKQGRAFTDCYSTVVSIPVTLPEFIEAFYTTRLFKLERWLLEKVFSITSSDEQVLLLAKSCSIEFSAWQVESRSSSEILLSAGQTRSWLSVSPQTDAMLSTTLYFGSAVVSKRPDGKFGFAFYLLGGFHRLYSKLLLSAAAKKVVRNSSRNAG